MAHRRRQRKPARAHRFRVPREFQGLGAIEPVEARAFAPASTVEREPGAGAELPAPRVRPPPTAPFFRRRVFGLPLWAVLLSGGALLAGVAFAVMWGTGMLTGTKLNEKQKAIFLASLPAYAKPFGPLILQVADEVGVDPFALFGLGETETRWGAAKAYKDQTGDWTPRLRTETAMAKLPEGALKIVATPSGKKDPPSGSHYVMPSDGLGFGRGIVQIDFEAQYDWVSTHDWRDDHANLVRGASYLKSLVGIFSGTSSIRPFSDGTTVAISPEYAAARGQAGRGGTYKDPRPLSGTALAAAALAAYNTGPGNVIRNLALGLPADASTATGSYASGTMQTMATLMSTFANAGGNAAA